MSTFPLSRLLDVQRMTSALRRRGPSGMAWHLVRRIGTRRKTALAGPDFLRINPMGVVCNHACPMCWLQHTPPDQLKEFQRVDREEGMRLEGYERLLAAMPPGLEEVNVVGGGEPLIHPDIIAIFHAIKRRGLRGSLITNGTLLKEDKARALVEMGWDFVRFSVHAGDRETFKAVQGVDRFETLRENIERLMRIRRESGRGLPRVEIFHVLQAANLASIDQMFRFSEEVGVDAIQFEKVIELDPAMHLSAGQFRAAADALEAAAARCAVPCNRDEILEQLRRGETCEAEGKTWRPAARCSVGFDQTYINSMGEVFPCCFSTEKMGDLREATFGEIWRGEKYAAFRRRLIEGKFAKYCIDCRCALPAVLHND